MKSLINYLTLLLLCFTNQSITIASIDDGMLQVFNVSDFGTKGDGSHLDTKPIQSAIRSCHEKGGGTVYFPAGEYLSGTIRLLSNVRLYLEMGAVIRSTKDSTAYDPRYLIYAENAENISIEGPGTLYGIGEGELGRRANTADSRETEFIRPTFRAGISLIVNCRDISIRDIRCLWSDTWTLNLRDCENIIIDGITIRNNYFHTNSDGIDPVSCKNVVIANCNISAGDDCIVLKSNGNGPCENVVVTNCNMESIATAVKIGTESPNDFRNIRISNCNIRNSTVGIGMFIKDGATAERISFSNISIENYPARGVTNLETRIYPIFLDIEQRYEDSQIGSIRDITIENIDIYSGFGVLIQGMDESPIENLSLKDINFRVYEPGDYSDRIKHVGGRRFTKGARDTLYVRKPSWVTVANIEGLTAENIKVYLTEDDFLKFERSAFHAYNTRDGLIRNVFRSQAGGGSSLPLVQLHNTTNMLVTGCIPRPGTPVVVGVSGEKTSNITIDSHGMEAAEEIYQLDEVDREQIRFSREE